MGSYSHFDILNQLGSRIRWRVDGGLFAEGLLLLLTHCAMLKKSTPLGDLVNLRTGAVLSVFSVAGTSDDLKSTAVQNNQQYKFKEH
jgi:hypothetical protein